MTKFSPKSMKAARLKEQLSQRDVAEALNISQTLYCHVETGKRPPNAYTVTHWAKAISIAVAARAARLKKQTADAAVRAKRLDAVREKHLQARRAR